MKPRSMTRRMTYDPYIESGLDSFNKEKFNLSPYSKIKTTSFKAYFYLYQPPTHPFHSHFTPNSYSTQIPLRLSTLQDSKKGKARVSRFFSPNSRVFFLGFNQATWVLICQFLSPAKLKYIPFFLGFQVINLNEFMMFY